MWSLGITSKLLSGVNVLALILRALQPVFVVFVLNVNGTGLMKGIKWGVCGLSATLHILEYISKYLTTGTKDFAPGFSL